MRIHKISLQNFRSIPHLRFEDLQNLNCFIGAHNSGKTNILDGISAFWDPFIRARVQQDHLKEESTGQIMQQAPPILSYINESTNIRGMFELVIDKSLDSWRESSYLRDIFTKTAFLHTQKQSYDFFNEFLENLETKTSLSNISAFKFDMTLSQEQLMFIVQECFLRLKDGELLPFKANNLPIIQQAIGTAFLRHFDETTEHKFLNENISRIIKNKDYKAITAIESFLKDVIGQEFVFELGHGQMAEVTIEQAFTTPLWRMSTGTLRIISLAYLLTASQLNQIIIIDDPGLYLHPKSERRLARKLENFSNERQILFSTHSTRLLIGHAYLVELIKGWTKVRPIRGEKTMKKVVKLLGIRPSDSLGADVVVFVEGKTDTRVFRVFENLLQGDRMSRNRVSFIGVGGWTNMKFIISIELLKSKFVRSRALAITDGDIYNSETYLKIKKNWTSVFPENTFFSLKEECIESLFLNNPVIFQRVLKKKNESLTSITEIQEFIKRNRERGISDKTITRSITERFLGGKRYKASVAERLAGSFKVNEIPEYLAKFFNEFILN